MIITPCPLSERPVKKTSKVKAGFSESILNQAFQSLCIKSLLAKKRLGVKGWPVQYSEMIPWISEWIIAWTFMKTTATTSMAKVPLLYLKRFKSSEGYLIRMISIYHHYLYPLYNTHSFTGLFNTSQVYPSKVYHGTWKWHPGLGDSFWKPSFFRLHVKLGEYIPKKTCLHPRFNLSCNSANSSPALVVLGGKWTTLMIHTSWGRWVFQDHFKDKKYRKLYPFLGGV